MKPELVILNHSLHVAPLRKPGDEGTAILCNVIAGGSPPE